MDRVPFRLEHENAVFFATSVFARRCRTPSTTTSCLNTIYAWPVSALSRHVPSRGLVFPKRRSAALQAGSRQGRRPARRSRLDRQRWRRHSRQGDQRPPRAVRVHADDVSNGDRHSSVHADERVPGENRHHLQREADRVHRARTTRCRNTSSKPRSAAGARALIPTRRQTSTPPAKPATTASYSNARVDELFKQGRREFDREKRAAIYGEIHKILWEDQPYTWLFYRNAFYGFNKKLRGYNFSPRGPFISARLRQHLQSRRAVIDSQLGYNAVMDALSF